jgi:NRPS condensation-like uncharacterized protein
LEATKAISKKLNCTINDLITAALSCALAKFLEEKGSENTKEINICMPVNIRW